jgi:DNA-binding NarL/FixJ family response regulator
MSFTAPQTALAPNVAGMVPAIHGVFLLGASPAMARLRRIVREAQPNLYLAGEADTFARGLQALRQCPCALVVLEVVERSWASLALLRECTDGRLVALTSYGEPDAVDQALAIGADAVLCGNDGEDAMLRAINRVLNGDVGLGAKAAGEFFMRAARRAAEDKEGPPRAFIGPCLKPHGHSPRR